MLNTSATSNNRPAKDQSLESEVEYRRKLQDIITKIYAASNLDDILINLKDEITNLFEQYSRIFCL